MNKEVAQPSPLEYGIEASSLRGAKSNNARAEKTLPRHGSSKLSRRSFGSLNVAKSNPLLMSYSKDSENCDGLILNVFSKASLQLSLDL